MTSDEFKSQFNNMSHAKESIKVLHECAQLQYKKSMDYQNPDSSVTQAMHYRRGIDSIHDIIHGKIYRAQSLIESTGQPNFESLEDTYKDIINYCSFAISYLRGKMEGQSEDRDMFNRLNKKESQIANFSSTSHMSQRLIDSIVDEDDGSRC